ncbi:hypothetical protein CC86DRAFT_371476 [Ophiobolus disseminans]|uniref:Uncharacterized protein n=1 Tax=Ophiobolus disseminans TaxID=1469910 RepID=A0A6A6ZVC4_9PLEO|nr:hypothetical protein CC86DRAFT_371476 [Ophiobolus disseminans]
MSEKNLIKERRKYIANEVKRWSTIFKAPIRIVEPADIQFKEIESAEVQLPLLLFKLTYPKKYPNILDFKDKLRDITFPLGDFNLEYLTFTIYQYEDSVDVKPGTDTSLLCIQMFSDLIRNCIAPMQEDYNARHDIFTGHQLVLADLIPDHAGEKGTTGSQPLPGDFQLNGDL